MASQQFPWWFWLGGVAGVGLLAMANTTQGRKTIVRVGATVAEELEQGYAWMTRIVDLTSNHEGTYDTVARNPDKAGLSFGRLQWAQRPGALGQLLEAMFERDPVLFKAIFGPSWQQLLTATKVGSLEPVGGVVLWNDPWVSRFRQAGKQLVFREVQDDLAISGVIMEKAIEAAGILGVVTERGVSVTYDTSCQQGGGGAVKFARQLMKNMGGKTSTPRQILEQYIALCAGGFRSIQKPAKLQYNKALVWQEVGNEWHVFAGSIDLYTNIIRRRTGLLNKPGLSDALVSLPPQYAIYNRLLLAAGTGNRT